MPDIGLPPSGGDQNKAPAKIVIQSVFGAIVLVFVCVRIYVRANIVRKLWWDDLFISLGTVQCP